MNSRKDGSSAPDPGARGSHLRILTVNLNTVRHPQEGPDGTRVVWSGPNGEHCEAQFDYERSQLKPEVENGERVEWINLTNQPCSVVFDEAERQESPFEKGERQFTIAPGRSVFSAVISGEKNKRYPYLVNFLKPPATDDEGDRGNPVIIVTG